MSDDPQDRVPIARFRKLKKAHEYGLVVLSGKEPYWVEKDEHGWLLYVPAESAHHLQDQLRLYEGESLHWPPKEPAIPEHPHGFQAVLAWATVLILGFGLQLQVDGFLDWGRLSAESVMSGEFWRLGTALILHGDIGHLVSNLAFGGLFLYCCSRLMGPAQAFFGTFLAGALGNFLNAWTYAEAGHFSIGASTAVFGSVGILASYPLGYGWRTLWKQRQATWWIPLGTGLIFLGWFGTGDANTDTTAHLYGFLAALPIGLAAGWLRKRRELAQFKVQDPAWKS